MRTRRTQPFRRLATATISIAAVAAGSVDCTCGKTGGGREPPAAFSVPSLYELQEARVTGDGLVVVARTQDSRRYTATALDARGRTLWQSPPATHVMLDVTSAGAIVLVDPDVAGGTAVGSKRSVALFVPASGRIERTFTVDRPRPIWDAWFRDGNAVFVVQQESSDAPATISAIGVPEGNLLWAREAGVITRVGMGPQLGAAPVVTSAHVYIQCQRPERSGDYAYDLCRFSRADGMLTKTFPERVVDFSSAGGETVYILRESSVEAVSPNGATIWTRSLPEHYRGDRIVASERWLAVMTTFVRSRQDYDERLLALDAKDGHELWTKSAGQGGGHFTSDLAITADRLVYFGNLTPQIRVVDARGMMMFEAPMATRAVVSTEVIGSFADPVRGGPFLSPTFLALAPGERGLEVYRIPRLER